MNQHFSGFGSPGWYGGLFGLFQAVALLFGGFWLLFPLVMWWKMNLVLRELRDVNLALGRMADEQADRVQAASRKPGEPPPIAPSA